MSLCTSEAAFPGLVREELAQARLRHPPVHSLHEGYAHLPEEMDELKEQVWKWPDHAPGKVVRELTQLAAYCQRMAEDLMSVGKDPAATEGEGNDGGLAGGRPGQPGAGRRAVKPQRHLSDQELRILLYALQTMREHANPRLDLRPDFSLEDRLMILGDVVVGVREMCQRLWHALEPQRLWLAEALGISPDAAIPDEEADGEAEEDSGEDSFS